MRLTPELAYTAGLIGGDGCLTQNRIEIADKSFEFHKKVIKPIFQTLFKTTPTISKLKTRKGNLTYRSRIYSEMAYRAYSEYLEIPEGRKKTFFMKTSRKILNARKNIVAAYVRGWMDAEGWITVKTIKRTNKTYVYPRIAFNVANKNVRDEIVGLLKRFGIIPSIWKSKNMFGLQIIGFEKTYLYSKYIGFNHPDKVSRLNNLACLSQNAAYNA